MSPSATSRRAKTCSLSISGRVLMSVTGKPRMTRSPGRSAPARRSNVFSVLNISLNAQKAHRLVHGREVLRDNGAISVSKDQSHARRLFIQRRGTVMPTYQSFGRRELERYLAGFVF